MFAAGAGAKSYIIGAVTRQKNVPPARLSRASTRLNVLLRLTTAPVRAGSNVDPNYLISGKSYGIPLAVRLRKRLAGRSKISF